MACDHSLQLSLVEVISTISKGQVDEALQELANAATNYGTDYGPCAIPRLATQDSTNEQ